MQLAVSPVGTAAYILRKVPTGPSRDATSGPEDLLRVGLFRSMVAALIRGEAGTEEGMESCIAIFRMDIALLNRKSQAQRVCNTALSSLHTSTIISSHIARLYHFSSMLRTHTDHLHCSAWLVGIEATLQLSSVMVTVRVRVTSPRTGRRRDVRPSSKMASERVYRTVRNE